MGNFTGVIIEESLANKDVLSGIKVVSTDIETVAEKHKTPWINKWTKHSVEIPDSEAAAIADAISKALVTDHAWYADFKNSTHHYIIFSNKIFYINRTSKEQYDAAKDYGISLGIPSYQVDFHPEVKQWER